MNYKFSSVVCGGTFDHLHAGHKAFLQFVFSQGEHVLIGLTTDIYIQKYKSNQSIAIYEQRKSILEKYLEEVGWHGRYTIDPIDEIFGPTITNTQLQAIIVTEATIGGAKAINNARQKAGQKELVVVVMPLVSKNGQILSSTAIRAGEMDIFGNRILPVSLREELQKPLGNIVHRFDEIQEKNQAKIITVGDVTSRLFLQHDIHPKLAIVDFLVERKQQYSSIEELGFDKNTYVFHVTNPPATLTQELWDVIREAKEQLLTSQHMLIQVTGEEDLAVLPLVILMPNGFSIFYGQPHVGLVEVIITEKLKEYCHSLLQKFTPLTRGS